MKVVVNLFYYPAPKRDLWFPMDRYLQKLYRLIRRGRGPSGPTRVFMNLCAGLTRVGVPYRVNDYEYARKHPSETACVTSHGTLCKAPLDNPILYGPSVIEYPVRDRESFARQNIPRILVSSEWQRQLYVSAWGERLTVWPVGIDTDAWSPSSRAKDIDLLIYDKLDTSVLFYEEGNSERNGRSYRDSLLIPIRRLAAERGLKTALLRYGFYREPQFRSLLKRCKGMVFLSRSETQGIAYLQALSCGVPIMAWDVGESWRERGMHERLGSRRTPVTSVPYWDTRCGLTFRNVEDFSARLDHFLEGIAQQRFAPRDYVLEHLTLRQCAESYLKIWHTLQSTSQSAAFKFHDDR